MVWILKIVVVCSLTWAIVKCENLQNLSVDQVADRLWSDMNSKGGTITEKDLDKEFIRLFDMDGDGKLKKFEFVEKWYTLYHDSKDTAQDVFDRLDIARDGMLSDLDYAAHFSAADRDSNKLLTGKEFKRFMIMMHPDTNKHDEL